jgi:hypothetical protein
LRDLHGCISSSLWKIERYGRAMTSRLRSQLGRCIMRSSLRGWNKVHLWDTGE